MYYGLVKYDDVKAIISSCEGAIAVCADALEISEPGTLSYAQIIATKHTTEKILERLRAIRPINEG